MNSNTIKTRHLKKSLLVALEKNMGNISAACKALKCHRDTFYYHYKRDLKFKEQVDSLSEVALDAVEDYLFRRIKKGDTTAIIFYLKTKGKSRGYIERQEVEQNGTIKIVINRKANAEL
jgi:hypothetical protein